MEDKEFGGKGVIDDDDQHGDSITVKKVEI